MPLLTATITPDCQVSNVSGLFFTVFSLPVTSSKVAHGKLNMMVTAASLLEICRIRALCVPLSSKALRVQTWTDT